MSVFELAATHSGTMISLNTGDYSVQLQGTSFGSPVRKPMYTQVYDSQRVVVAGAPVEAREQQLRVLVTGSSIADLQSNLDDVYELCDEITRKGGGTLTHNSTGSVIDTVYRVRFAQATPPEKLGAEYEVAFRAMITIGLVVDPYGHGAEATSLSSGSKVFPLVVDVAAPGGTEDALADIYYTATSGTPSVMMYSWWPSLAVHNFCQNGGAEEIGSNTALAYGWTAAALAGVISAGTSVARTTTAGKFRSGVAGIEAVTPATTDTGIRFAIYRRDGFKAGVTYTAQCYVRSAADTTAVRIKLGVSGDLGTGTASALTSTFAIRTVTWTPATDVNIASVAIGVNAATATTFQVDDVLVFEGTTAPTFEAGGFGPGIIPAGAYSLAAASLTGSAWTATTDTDYLVGSGPQASGALSTNGNLDFPILPHLFTPDDYTLDEVDVAVFARVEVASTQTGLACAISMAPDRGTSYGARRYGTFASTGKTLKLPSSGTVFKPYYLGTVTLKVDRSKPRREWLRLSFTNGGGATGTVGVDYLVAVPVRSTASSRRGAAASVVPTFLSGTSIQKLIRHDLSGAVIEADGTAQTPDDGLGGEPLHLPKDGCELLVWPSDQVVDLTDSSASGMSETFTGSVIVKTTPRYNLLKQA